MGPSLVWAGNLNISQAARSPGRHGLLPRLMALKMTWQLCAARASPVKIVPRREQGWNAAGVCQCIRNTAPVCPIVCHEL